MPEEVWKHLFELDKVTSRAGTSNESVSGYGLSLAKHFTESFSGTLEVSSIEQSENSKDHGTIFTILIPKIDVRINL